MSRTAPIGSLAPGVNNRLEPTQLRTVLQDGRTKATFLYGADNVDINAKGYLRRRAGQTLMAQGNAHSLWPDGLGGYVVIDGVLRDFVMQGTALAGQPIRQGLPRLPISYSRGADGEVYWSNGQVIRRIAAGRTDRPIATEPLDAVPEVTVTAGALRGGRYLVAFTARGPDGESPATPVTQVEVPENGGIAFTTGRAVEVYLSAPNGDVLTHQAAGVSGAAAVVTHTENGRRCETLNTALTPAGTVVRHHQGRMLVASGNVLFASNPYHYGIYDPSSGYFPFPAPISVIEPTDNGVYICADKTYWIDDLFADVLQEVLPYGAVPGTSGRSPIDEQVFWQSTRGLVVADKNQTAKNVQEHALELSAASSGASLFRERNGSHHIVSTRFGVEPSVAAATSFMDAEVVRKGTLL